MENKRFENNTALTGPEDFNQAELPSYYNEGQEGPS